MIVMPTDVNLDFSSAISGTLLDKDGEGTGFTSVQANTANNAYDLGRIDLNPSASTLVLTGTQGSHGGSNNTLKNALETPISSSTGPFTISTRLKGPFTSLTTIAQQGGIFLGPDQDNYVKVVVTNSGALGLGLQFNQEQSGTRSNVGGGSEIRNLDWATISTLDLFLSGNPATGALAAAYRVNSDTAAPISFSQQFTPTTPATFFAPETTSRAGILAFTRDAPDATVTFDSFNIQYTQPLAPSNGNIQVSTPDAGIVQNRMVFSTVNEEVRASKTLTLSNTGPEPLTITGLNFGDSQEKANAVRTADHRRAADFQLVNAQTLPITLAANTSVNLDVQFAPQRISRLSRSTTHTLNGENYAALTISSNDHDQPTVKVDLAGLNYANYTGSNEPSVAEIARTFGWTLNVGTENHILGGAKTLVGDEVYAPYWVSADTSKPVELWPLAVNVGSTRGVHDAVRFEAKPGSGGNSGLLYEVAGTSNDDGVLGSNDQSGGENQKLLPKIWVNSVNTLPTRDLVDFTPTTAFALKNSNVSSTDDSQNGINQLHNWRTFPVRDAQGTLVPNSWYVTQDVVSNLNGSTTKNFDYNDLVYLLVNAKPESAVQDPAIPGALPGAPSLVFDFNQAYAGSLADKDGESIGFTSTLLNKNDTFTGITSYSPALLNIDTTGVGTLNVTTTTGSNGTTDNTLVNGLGTTFDGRTAKSIISTRLIGPLDNITTPVQQGGVMFGPDQDNFIKLVAIAQPGGTLGMQFYSERKGVGTTIGPIIPVASPSNLQSLELSLLTDPQTGSVQAAYRAIYPNSDPGMVILPGSSVKLTGGQFGHYFAAQSKAGIITSSKNATPINIAFDSFAITPG